MGNGLKFVYITPTCLGVHCTIIRGCHSNIRVLCAITIKYFNIALCISFIHRGEKVFRSCVVVQRINTRRLQSTHANTHSSTFIPSKPKESRDVISNEFSKPRLCF
jgi:hypothetical protein